MSLHIENLTVRFAPTRTGSRPAAAGPHPAGAGPQPAGAGSQWVTALDSVSLDLEPGEMFFLLGPSGCGKTTLLRVVAGFIDDYEGTVSIDRPAGAGSHPAGAGSHPAGAGSHKAQEGTLHVLNTHQPPRHNK